MVRDPAIAEDVAQETLVDVWRQAPRFDASKGKAVSWIVTIAHRRAVDRVRSEQARSDREMKARPTEAATDGDIGKHLESKATSDEIAAGLTVLTEVQRIAVQLAFYEGRTHQEVAQLLDIPLGTAKTRIRDGLIRLRDALESPRSPEESL